MSIKDDVNYIKNELSNEEKFLEGFVKTERFFKKYKKLIFIAIVLLIVGSLSWFIKSKMDKSNLYESNLAFNSYLEKGDDVSLETLKDKNKELYELALYLKSKNSFKKTEISLQYLKEILDFQVAASNLNLDDLRTVSKQSDFLLKDYAIFNEALILANEKKFVEAKEILNTISSDSRAFELATLLKHYLVTK